MSIIDQYAGFKDLPQLKHLTEVRMQAFVDYIKAKEPERLLDFHIPRLRGIGGSESSKVIAEAFGENTQFGCKRTFVQGKLLMELPEEGTPHTLRGTLNEPVIRDFFRKQTGCIVHDDALVALSKTRHSKHSWMVGMPDELVTIGGKTFLIDYKCPQPGFASEWDACERGVPFAYETQLHHYTLIARDAGIKIDGLMLVGMDAVLPGLLEVRVVDFNQSIFEAIEDLGNETWNQFVMTGQLPPWPVNENRAVPLDAEANPEIVIVLDEISKLKALGGEAATREKELKEWLKTMVTKAGINKAASHGVMNVNFKEGLDEERLITRIKANEMDPESAQFRDSVPDAELMKDVLEAQGTDPSTWKVAGDYNLEAMRDALVALGEPVETFMTLSSTVLVSRAKKMADEVTTLKIAASTVIDAYAPHYAPKDDILDDMDALMETSVGQVAEQLPEPPAEVIVNMAEVAALFEGQIAEQLPEPPALVVVDMTEGVVFVLEDKQQAIEVVAEPVVAETKKLSESLATIVEAVIVEKEPEIVKIKKLSF